MLVSSFSGRYSILQGNSIQLLAKTVSSHSIKSGSNWLLRPFHSQYDLIYEMLCQRCNSLFHCSCTKSFSSPLFFCLFLQHLPVDEQLYPLYIIDPSYPKGDYCTVKLSFPYFGSSPCASVTIYMPLVNPQYLRKKEQQSELLLSGGEE